MIELNEFIKKLESLKSYIHSSGNLGKDIYVLLSWERPSKRKDGALISCQHRSSIKDEIDMCYTIYVDIEGVQRNCVEIRAYTKEILEESEDGKEKILP